LLPQIINPTDRDKPTTVESLAEIVELTRSERERAGLVWDGYDVILEADSYGDFVTTEPKDPAAWAEAGATWWIESWWSLERGPEGLAELRRRVESGPPASS
jgi:hypothetical protein